MVAAYHDQREGHWVPFPEIKIAATGHWRNLLTQWGVQLPSGSRHGPCPYCGGKDRFRFDDKQGRGTWFCNQCGAGDGFSLLAKVLGVSVAEVFKLVEEHLGMAPSQRAEGNVRLQKPSSQHAYDEDEKRKRAYNLASQLLAASRPASESNAYLRRKRVLPHGSQELAQPFWIGQRMFPEGTLVIPIVGEGLQSAQLITGDGSKFLIPGGAVKGAFYPTCSSWKSASRVWLAEGFATAASAQELIGEPVLCCFFAGNLEPVAQVLRRRFPNLELVIIADNDESGAGLRAAESAATAVNGSVFLARAVEAHDGN